MAYYIVWAWLAIHHHKAARGVDSMAIGCHGAQGRTRTGTVLPPRDFKSLASTNFATWANAWTWRLRPESNRRPRLCRPLHNHSATQPKYGIEREPRVGRILGTSSRTFSAAHYSVLLSHIKVPRIGVGHYRREDCRRRTRLTTFNCLKRELHSQLHRPSRRRHRRVSG